MNRFNPIVLVVTLAIFFLTSTKLQGQDELDKKSGFAYFMKLTELNRSDFAAEYLYETNPEVYKKYWNDEFEFNSKLNDQAQNIKNDIENLGKDFKLLTKAEFGDYNFETGSFDFNVLSESSYFNIKYSPSYLYCEKCQTFTRIDLFFTNTNEFNILPVPQEKANTLVKNRKNSYGGKVDRDVVMKIYYRLTDKYDIQTRDKKHEVKLYGEIYKIEVINSYGIYNDKGDGRVISVITPDTPPQEYSASTDSEDPEVAKLKSYISSSFVDQDLKGKLLEVIESHKN